MVQVCMQLKSHTGLLPNRPNPCLAVGFRGSGHLCGFAPRLWPRSPRRSDEAVCRARQPGRNDLDPWRTLGVSEGSDEKAIKRAFRKLALRHHPDLDGSPDAHIRFMAAQRAYEILIGRGRGKEDREGVWSEGGGWDFHDWYWEFSMNRRRGAARGPRAPASGAAGAPPETLQSQLAGLKRKAAFRQAQPTPAPASASHMWETAADAATAPHMSQTAADVAGAPHISETESDAASAPHMSGTAPDAASAPHVYGSASDAASAPHMSETAVDAPGAPHIFEIASDAASAPHMFETAADAGATSAAPSPSHVDASSDTSLLTQEAGERANRFERSELAQQSAASQGSRLVTRARQWASPSSAAQADASDPAESTAGSHTTHMPSLTVPGSGRSTDAGHGVWRGRAHDDGMQAGGLHAAFHAAAHHSAAIHARAAGLHGLDKEEESYKQHTLYVPSHVPDARLDLAREDEHHQAGAANNAGRGALRNEPADTSLAAEALTAHHSGPNSPAYPGGMTFYGGGKDSRHGHSQPLGGLAGEETHLGNALSEANGHFAVFDWQARGRHGGWAERAEGRESHSRDADGLHIRRGSPKGRGGYQGTFPPRGPLGDVETPLGGGKAPSGYSHDARRWHPRPGPLADLLACAQEFFAEVALRRAGGRSVVEATFSSLGAHISAVTARSPRVPALVGAGQVQTAQRAAPGVLPLPHMAESEIHILHGDESPTSQPSNGEPSAMTVKGHGGISTFAATLSSHDTSVHVSGGGSEGEPAQHHLFQAPVRSRESGPSLGDGEGEGSAHGGEGGQQCQADGAKPLGDIQGHGPDRPSGAHAEQLQNQLAGLKRRAALRRPQT